MATPLREPIGCNEKEAMRFLGCSANMFAEYKTRKIILPLRKGWYAYADLERAVEWIREDRDKTIYLNGNEKTASGMEGEQEGAEEMGGQGHQPRFRKTAELLGRIQG